MIQITFLIKYTKGFISLCLSRSYRGDVCGWVVTLYWLDTEINGGRICHDSLYHGGMSATKTTAVIIRISTFINMMEHQRIMMLFFSYPDGKVHGANMGPSWVLSAPDGPHVGPMNLAIRVTFICFVHHPYTKQNRLLIYGIHCCHFGCKRPSNIHRSTAAQPRNPLGEISAGMNVICHKALNFQA